MDFSQPLSIIWWFTLRPGPISSPLFYWGLISLVAFFFILSLVVFFLPSRRVAPFILRRLYSKILRFSLSMGTLALLFLFFSFEEIPFLSMRIWWAFWLIGALVWIIFLTRAAYKIPHKIRQAEQHREEFLKYLPM